MDRFKFIYKSNINKLPKTAGVYCFASPKPKGEGGFEVIYIGKAINIQNRVKNHFNQPSYRDNLFMDKVDKIGFLKTNSEIEALILEANLIKKHQPKFNVVWRDDKNYFYVAITKEKRPSVYITHQPFDGTQGKKNDKADYIGPFVEGVALKKTLRFLRRAFPYYSQRKHPKIKCTYCHLDLCPGPQPDLKLYKNNLKNLKLVLEGKRINVFKNLKKEMNLLAKEKKFEEAGKIRDRMQALKQIMAHTRVIEAGKTFIAENPNQLLARIIGVNNISRIECYDVSNIQGKQATASMVVFVDGQPDKNEYRKFKIKMQNEPNDIAMLKEAITRRLTHAEWKFPDVILIDGGIAQLNAGIEAKGNKNIKVISIAKRNKELFIEKRKNPILLKTLPQEIYNLIIHLDDEAHRFAITYHKKLRSNDLLR